MNFTHHYTVSELNGKVSDLLEHEIGNVCINAEISNFSAPSSGHWYFSLKDEHSQIRAAMFNAARLCPNFMPQNGMQVLLTGRISVYSPRGEYQIVAHSIVPAGEGLLQLQFEQLKKSMQEQGWFNVEHKKPIKPVNKIGVITSPTTAALQDILQVLKRRNPNIEVVVYPALVQGDKASQTIIRAMQRAVARNEVDALLLARGGGSSEDLWCFNDETLAHAIYHCPLPIVSAIGHEIDFTISDFVADLRAPTPSAGAELLSKDVGEQQDKLTHLSQQMTVLFNQYWQRQVQKLEQLNHRLLRQHPESKINQNRQQLDEYQYRLAQSIQSRLHQLALQTESINSRLRQANPQHTIAQHKQHVKQLQHQLHLAAHNTLEHAQQRASHLYQQLNQLSPLNVLGRGYAIASQNEKALITTKHIDASADVHIRLQSGSFTAKVSHIDD